MCTGTPEYMAPEVVSGRGYNYGADWWGLGVLIYEMATGGCTPFESGTQHRVFQKILRHRGRGLGRTPSGARGLTNVTMSVISALLQPSPTHRLGCWRDGAEDIKQHEFFAGLDWDSLHAHALSAPFIPPILDAADTSRFSAPVASPQSDSGAVRIEAPWLDEWGPIDC